MKKLIAFLFVLLFACSVMAKPQKTLLIFYGDKCVPCKWMEKHTFENPVVEATLKDYDVQWANIDVHLKTKKKYGVTCVPTVILLDENGHEIKRESGAMDATEFLSWLNK